MLCAVLFPARGPHRLTAAHLDGTVTGDGDDGGPIVSDHVRKKSNHREELGQDSTAFGGDPLYSHIRELAPREGAHISETSTMRDRRSQSGFFAQAARISMGTAFPALRSVARFLKMESYRSLPKLDNLPNLDDDVIEADLDDLLESPEAEPQAPGEQLLDWDELEIDDLTPTAYRLHLFDVRIKGYLRQTKAQLSPLLRT